MEVDTVKKLNFACVRCRSGKRKCDGVKPTCSLCGKLSKACVYPTELKSRKRKYWDEDYVHSLEDQVKCLMSLLRVKEEQKSTPTSLLSHFPGLRAVSCLNIDVETTGDDSETDAEPFDHDAQDTEALLTEDRSQIAITELGVMLWRTNIGDGVSIDADTSDDNKSLHEWDTASGKESRTDTASRSRDTFQDSAFFVCAENVELTWDLASSFLEGINPFHQFVFYDSPHFLKGFPNQEPSLLFLHCAILSAGALFSDRSNATMAGNVFGAYAEAIAVQSCRHSPSLPVIQGLCILTWRELSAGRDSMAWMYISMAAAVCVQLRLHVLAFEEILPSPSASSRSALEIRTYWTFYILDRGACSILGRNCAFPWRRTNVPSFESAFGHSTASLAEVSFGSQCKLWYLHDSFMDQIYASTFHSMLPNERGKLLVTAHESLVAFYKDHDKRLIMTSASPPKPILFFHMAYQMSLLLLHPPFLQRSSSSSGSLSNIQVPIEPDVFRLTLRSITAAALTMTRLVRIYLRAHTFTKAPPLLVHHILSAAVVHVMNSTSSHPPMRKQSTRSLRLCLDFLTQLQPLWPTRAGKSIKLIQALADRWKVVAALPMHLSYPLDFADKQKVGKEKEDLASEAGTLYTVLGTLADTNEGDLSYDTGAYDIGWMLTDDFAFQNDYFSPFTDSAFHDYNNVFSH